MARRFINLAVIFIVICCELVFGHAEFNVSARYFIDLTEFRRPILVEQTQIIPDDCTASCNDPKIEAQLAKNINPMSYEGLNSKCNGWLEKCVDFSGWYGAPAKAEYCSSNEHLTWAKDANLTEYGHHWNKCNDTDIKSVPSANVIAGQNCYTCLCVCTKGSEDKLSDNWAFSLQSQVADVANNKIVVGVRFRSENKMIRMEIKEAEFNSRYGGTWKSVDKVENLVRNVDYSLLTPKSRSIQLERIIVPANCIITGVRFARKSTNLDGQEWVLRMEVQGTKVDEKSGELMKNTSTWYNFDDMDTSSSNYKKPRFELSREEKLAWNGNSQLMIFETTNIKSDLGAHVKPYLDMNDYEFGYNSYFRGIELNYVNDMSGQVNYLVPNIYSDNINAEIIGISNSETTTSVEMPTSTPGMGTSLKAPAYSIYAILLLTIALFCYGI